jgi:hypothetical protein
MPDESSPRILDDALQQRSALLAHQCLELTCKRVSCDFFAEKESRDGDDDQKDGGKRNDGIERHRGTAAQCVVIDERLQGFLQQVPGVFEH